MKDQALLDKIDLHLIRVLHTVLTDRSVSRAAIRLGMYQPAVSAALKRLRELSGDPLLVRSGSGMVPTDAGLRMIEPSAAILRSAEVLFSDARGFDPQTAATTFRIAASDYLDPLFLPHAGRAGQGAGAAVRASRSIALTSDSDYHAHLSLGHVDLVIGNWLKPPEDLHMARLFGDDIVSLVNQRPSGRAARLDGRDLAGKPSTSRPRPCIPARAASSTRCSTSMGRQRNITARCAHFGLIPDMVASSLLVLTTGRQYCERFLERLPVTILECPIPLPRLMYYQLWHERTHSSSSARWLRDRTKSVAASLRPSAG